MKIMLRCRVVPTLIHCGAKGDTDKGISLRKAGSVGWWIPKVSKMRWSATIASSTNVINLLAPWFDCKMAVRCFLNWQAASLIGPQLLTQKYPRINSNTECNCSLAFVVGTTVMEGNGEVKIMDTGQVTIYVYATETTMSSKELLGLTFLIVYRLT